MQTWTDGKILGVNYFRPKIELKWVKIRSKYVTRRKIQINDPVSLDLYSQGYVSASARSLPQATEYPEKIKQAS